MKTQMQLGTQTGSLINHVLSNYNDATPVVGMGCTILGWSDRHAATIVEVSKNRKTIAIQKDIAVRTDKNGMSEMQSYDFTPNPNATKEIYTLRKNGRWIRKGDSIKGNHLKIGARQEYYDFSF